MNYFYLKFPRNIIPLHIVHAIILACTVNGSKGNGNHQGSCGPGLLCLGDGTCRGKILISCKMQLVDHAVHIWCSGVNKIYVFQDVQWPMDNLAMAQCKDLAILDSIA